MAKNTKSPENMNPAAEETTVLNAQKKNNNITKRTPFGVLFVIVD